MGKNILKFQILHDDFMRQLIGILTAMYCHPLLTRTSNASSSIMNAIVPTGLEALICNKS